MWGCGEERKEEKRRTDEEMRRADKRADVERKRVAEEGG